MTQKVRDKRFLLHATEIGIAMANIALVVKILPANAGDARDSSSIPGWGRSPGEGKGNPLQYSCLENSMDRGDCRAIVLGVMKSQT